MGRRLLAARKDRDTPRTSALRSALAAIDNAETPDGERLTTADEFTAGGHPQRAAALPEEVAVLTDLLGDV